MDGDGVSHGNIFKQIDNIHIRMVLCEPAKITYTSGYPLIAKADITKRDSKTLCTLLNEEFNDGCTFAPEATSEGGIK